MFHFQLASLLAQTCEVKFIKNKNENFLNIGQYVVKIKMAVQVLISMSKSSMAWRDPGEGTFIISQMDFFFLFVMAFFVFLKTCEWLQGWAKAKLHDKMIWFSCWQ